MRHWRMSQRQFRVVRIRSLARNAPPARPDPLEIAPVVPVVDGDEAVSAAFFLRLSREFRRRRKRDAVRGIWIIEEGNPSFLSAARQGEQHADQRDNPHQSPHASKLRLAIRPSSNPRAALCPSGGHDASFSTLSRSVRLYEDSCAPLA